MARLRRPIAVAGRPGRPCRVGLPYPRGVEAREDAHYFELVTSVRELLRKRGEHLLPAEEPAL